MLSVEDVVSSLSAEFSSSAISGASAVSAEPIVTSTSFDSSLL